MKFCPKCGIKLVQGVRFCEHCGYDTLEESVIPDEQQVPLSTAEINPQPDEVRPDSLTSKIQPAIPAYSSSGKALKGKNQIAWILLFLIGAGAIGTAGWYGYNRFLKGADSEIPPIDSTLMIDESTSSDTAMATSNAQESRDSLKAEKVTSPLAEEKTATQAGKEAKSANHAQQPKPATKSTTAQKENASPTKQVKPTGKPGVSAKTVPDEPDPGKALKVVFSSNTREIPKHKGPKNPTRFSLSKSTMIMRIVTDHFNGNRGTSSVGVITIKDKKGKVIGTYKAVGKKGSKGTINGKWVVEPRLRLAKGVYFIHDSDPSTWSKNFLGAGFVEIEGYQL